MSLAKAQTWTSQSGGKCTNHGVTTPLIARQIGDVKLLETGSLDNAIQEFSLAWPLWVKNHYIITKSMRTP